ncbi:hypothetical protein ACWGKR_30820 [Bacillus thuringiensis]|uniref:hypothetical protein n=1 Tax=Bacillus cereus group TaxID=86661 RepID=UPI000BF4CCB1|nr:MULTISPECIES: hypothetical protein [Bacillus cereus group]MCU7679412.1 hypothetical protein [Bacillus thuringiensis]PFA93079.1 hypothetical protein CN393_01925 [Bacillus cereus]
MLKQEAVVELLQEIDTEDIFVATSYLVDLPSFIYPYEDSDNVCLKINKKELIKLLEVGKAYLNGVSTITLAINELYQLQDCMRVDLAAEQTLRPTKRLVNCIGIALNDKNLIMNLDIISNKSLNDLLHSKTIESIYVLLSK